MVKWNLYGDLTMCILYIFYIYTTKVTKCGRYIEKHVSNIFNMGLKRSICVICSSDIYTYIGYFAKIHNSQMK